jgi:hypothetical protein
MTTLIIHPNDSSTSFLDRVYAPIEDKTVITGGVSKPELIEMIKTHDRVMMMGHGSPWGLFDMGQFHLSGAYIIDISAVPVLREKKDSVFIWCHAQKFVDTFKLNGFYSGMFVSEVGEAHYCNIPGVGQSFVDHSNYSFVDILAKYINSDSKLIHENVVREYGVIAETNPVAKYNVERLYLNT